MSINIFIKVLFLCWYYISFMNSIEINSSQQCFIDYLNFKKPNESCYKRRIFSSFPKTLFMESNISKLYSKINGTDKLYSSVWCTSSNISGLRCRFKNLCFLPEKNVFMFISSSSSILYGVKSIFDMVNNLFSSSVNYHNAFQIPFSVVNKSTLLNKCVNYVEKDSILISRFKPDNLQHIFHDDLLPLYFTLQEFSFNSVSIIIDNLGKLEYDYLYKAVSKDLYFIFDFPSEILCFSQAHIGLNKISIFNHYQYNFSTTFTPISPSINKYHLHLFVKDFVETFHLPSDSSVQKKNFKISIINRKMNRKIFNILDLKILLEKHFLNKYNFAFTIQILSLEDDGVIYIIKEILSTDILIGMHGACLILSLFLPPSSSLIELWPFGLDPSIVPVYKTICEIKEIDYHSWVNEDIENTILHPEYPTFYGGIENWNSENYTNLLLKLSLNNLKNILCCNDPEWLFRIYQDTIVNVYVNNNLKSTLIQNIIDSILINFFKSNKSLSENLIPDSQRYLSQVENVTCSQNYSRKDPSVIMLIVKWTEPWNKDKIGCKKIHYEVVLRELYSNREDITHFYYTEEIQFFKRFFSSTNLQVWISSYCDHIQGASVFVLCSQVEVAI